MFFQQVTSNLSRLWQRIVFPIFQNRSRTNRKLIIVKCSGNHGISRRLDNLQRNKSLYEITQTLIAQLKEQPLSIKMSDPIHCLPVSVRGMTTLDRDLFTCFWTVPCVRVSKDMLNLILKTMKKCLLKLKNMMPVAHLGCEDPFFNTHKLILLNPAMYGSLNDFSEKEFRFLQNRCGVKLKKMEFFDLEMNYNNFSAFSIFKAVLPMDAISVSSYNIIGHIAHFNLKPEILDYKHVIGQVIMDKNKVVRTVVNKVNTIDNTFCNFKMELLAGDENYVTEVKENGCIFHLDFSKVYWNPRLSTEHMRIVDLINAGDILFDVFAGIGPFSIQAAKKGATVYANDLNPDCYDALVKNVKLNKLKGHVECYNMDGRQFIRTILKKELVSLLMDRLISHPKQVSEAQISIVASSADKKESCEDLLATDVDVQLVDDSTEEYLYRPQKVYVTMNLPVKALEFLDSFCGLLDDFPGQPMNANLTHLLPTLICYCFTKSDHPESDIGDRAEGVMRHALPPGYVVRRVRDVAPNKDMMCLMCTLSSDILFRPSSVLSTIDEPSAKKSRLSDAS